MLYVCVFEDFDPEFDRGVGYLVGSVAGCTWWCWWCLKVVLRKIFIHLFSAKNNKPGQGSQDSEKKGPTPRTSSGVGGGVDSFSVYLISH